MMGRMDSPDESEAEAAAGPAVGVGRPPVLAPAPGGLPLSTGAVASSPRERLARGERRGALRHSVWEGVFASAHAALSGNGAGGNVFTIGFALLLGAKDPALGVLVALPQIATVVQALAAYAARRVERRRPVVVLACSLSRATILLWPLLPLVFARRSALAVFLALWAFSSLAGSWANNAWMSWMADLVPRAVRGRYFSIRNNLSNLASLVISVGAASALDAFAGAAPGLDAAADARRLRGFALVFALAVVAGAISTWLLTRQFEPARHAARGGEARFRDFVLRPLRDPSFRPLVLFYAFFWAVNGLPSPFWTPFMLEDLHLSYKIVTALALLNGIMGLLTLPLWGRFADRFGAKPVMAIVVIATATHPIYYILATPAFPLPVLFDAISSGIMWGGFNLAIFNLVLESAPRGAGREMYYAAFNGAGGLAMAATAALAGGLVGSLPHVALFGHALLPRQVVFAATTVLRVLALVLLARVREPRGRLRAEEDSVPMRERGSNLRSTGSGQDRREARPTATR
jgi:MFS family permease